METETTIRFKVWQYVKSHPNCRSTDIVAAFNIRQVEASRHLKMLHDADCVTRRSSRGNTFIFAAGKHSPQKYFGGANSKKNERKMIESAAIVAKPTISPASVWHGLNL